MCDAHAHQYLFCISNNGVINIGENVSVYIIGWRKTFVLENANSDLLILVVLFTVINDK